MVPAVAPAPVTTDRTQATQPSTGRRAEPPGSSVYGSRPVANTNAAAHATRTESVTVGPEQGPSGVGSVAAPAPSVAGGVSSPASRAAAPVGGVESPARVEITAPVAAAVETLPVSRDPAPVGGFASLMSAHTTSLAAPSTVAAVRRLGGAASRPA